jgi:hypothetical protein
MTTTTYHPMLSTDSTTSDTRERKLTVDVGTFADGQRSAPLTASYPAEVGSFETPSGSNRLTCTAQTFGRASKAPARTHRSAAYR